MFSGRSQSGSGRTYVAGDVGAEDLRFGPGRALWFDQKDYFPLEQGYEIVNIPTPTYLRQKLQDFKLGLNIEFGQSETVAGKSVLETLNEMAKFVNGVISSFEPFLI